MGYFNMKKIALIFGLLPLVAHAETDATSALNETINVVRAQCSGISAKMDNIKKMAGIGTAVNAVGTATGVGGVASGVVKWYKDKDTLESIAEKKAVDLILQELKEKKQLSAENQELLQKIKTISPKLEKNLSDLAADLDKESSDDKKISTLEQRKLDIQKDIDKSQKQSTAAGNARTALFAVDTATNVAGAVVSSKTVADEDLVEQIKKCTESIDLLRKARARAQFEDDTDLKSMDISKKILEKCSEYEYVNVQQINNLAKGAMVTNSVGAVSGTVATITSAIGNNKKVSDIQSTQEFKKYNGTNVASNVLGGVTTAASLTGTALNATQIKEAKKIINISQECEEALQW